MRGDNGEKGGRVVRNMYKGHLDKTKGGRIKGGKWGQLVWVEWWGRNGDNCILKTI